MSSSQLINALSFTGLVVGVPQIQLHGININGVATIPDIVIPSAGPLTIVVTSTTVTVTRANPSQPTSVVIFLIKWHTVQGVLTVPPPFTAPIIVDQASGAASASGWTDDGTNVRLTTVTDTVSIGAATPLAGEKVRIVGDLLLQGNLLPDEGPSNTVFGQSAGSSITTGINNTLIGLNAGSAIATGNANTVLGLNALLSNVGSSDNTAIGAAALQSNTTGASNTCVGFNSGFMNTTGVNNTAVGYASLFSNTAGGNHTAIGLGALQSNTTGSLNTAVGFAAGFNNTTGDQNTGVGDSALLTLTTGNFNTALGRRADVSAGAATGRIAIGISSGGAGATATIDDGLFFHTSLATVAAGTTVLYDAATGQMGPMVSSRRFKENISALETDSEKLFWLRPVSYDLKETGVREFGYIAEEVAEIIPQVVPRDKDNIPLSVHYDRLVVLLVEEVKKLRAQFAELRAELSR